ncbi:MAG: hypothetical protein WHX93_14335 [bacterium]
MKVRWGFDIDSVVGDLSAILERVAWEEFGVRVSRAQFTEFQLENCLPFDSDFILKWISTALEPRWTLQMEPYPGAVEALREISQVQPLYFVTARPDSEGISLWLQQILQGVPKEHILVKAVGIFETKLPALKEWNITHFVEDRLETCKIIAQNGIVPIVFEQPWNLRSHPWPRVRGWEEILAMVRSFKLGGGSWPE